MNERAARAERRLELPVLVAALLVVPVIVIEESSLGQPWDTIGVALNWASWLTFLAEAVVMLSVVPDRRAWLRRHPIEVAVVVLTPPFLAALAPVRLLRVLRLLRLVRLAALARHFFSPEGLRYAALLAALTTLVGGAAYAELEEGQSTAEGMYWALTTITTVGYGDLSPDTTGGRFSLERSCSSGSGSSPSSRAPWPSGSLPPGYSARPSRWRRSLTPLAPMSSATYAS
jgi:voltage-gated potassium channel